MVNRAYDEKEGEPVIVVRLDEELMERRWQLGCRETADDCKIDFLP